MGMKGSGTAEDFRVVHEGDHGFGWIAYPDEEMQRASAALVGDDEQVWVCDPVDVPGLDELLAEHGEVGGVVVTLDRHKRDSAALANRHDVPVYLPMWFTGVADDLDAPVERFGNELAESGFRTLRLRDGRFWQEAGLYNEETGTLWVPESVGAASYFLAKSERLGVHPALRAFPPRRALGSLTPERVLVGHGEGVATDASRALSDALAGSRKRMLGVYARTARNALPF
ncbi:hypothetical protein [Haloarchaeobius iranensis]|uniref:Glyoxylase, beta-lactamase superfamily II n=1 Tax=Haloarchaeobius iranensis TaxID=996166 RepID=A0A1G9UN64_9EURY|nr:hypothetical protein [Haloarchaeobius iranensis]SDM61307.1 hypothetical protein SAMN05192554_104222 [Haloarchaeobius iranensis]